MPLIAWLVAAHLAGLLAGFTKSGAVVGALALACGIGAIATSRTRIAVSAAVCGAGVWSASATRQAKLECARWAGSQHAVPARLLDDAARGGFLRAELRCGARASVFVARGSGAAGAVAVIGGQISVTSDSAAVVIRNATVRVSEGAPWTARARSAALRSTDRDFGEDAPLVRALVLADMRAMSPDIRDRWAAAGMVHMLSVSGLHVGIIAAVAELLFVAMRVSRRAAPIAAVVLIVVYVAVIGAPAPAVRSALMLALRALSRMAQRSVSPWAILAIGASHPAVDPEIVLDLGYQLSVIGVGALISAGSLIKRLPLKKRPAWAREIASAVVTTCVATIASLPLVAWSMGRVSLIAPISNVIAGPFVALAQPMLFLGVLLAPIPSAAQFVADAAHPVLAAMNGIATVTADVPSASVGVWPSTTAAILCAIVAVAALVACREKHPARALTIGAFASALLAWLPAPRGGRMTELHVIDVGQGDAIALRTQAGRWVLFDAGRIWEGGDAGRRTIIPYIAHRGGPLEAFVLSHPHADHVGGAASVIDAMRPAVYVDGAFVSANEAYRASLVAARGRGARWQRVRPGDSLVVDEATIVFLAPDSSFAANLPDPNNASTVALIRIGAVRMLMMGDAEREEEEWLLANARDRLEAEVLKVGHHGSSTSSTAAFLDAVQPRIAVVSVGAGNTYRHPSMDVMTSLAERGAEVIRTDQRGTVVLETDGRRVRVRGQ